MSDGPYTLLRELGTGTWGTVYEAEVETDTSSGRVAVKVLHPVWERHETAAAALEEDLRRLRDLNHQNIGWVEALVTLQGRKALVMELVEGVDLHTLVRTLRKENAQFPVRASLDTAAQVAAALDAAHGRGVIHRDLKPGNVVLTPGALAKVLDFGVARDEFEEAEAFTQSVRYGSLRYREPERRGGGTASPAGDVYALGAVLYELLSLRPIPNAELDAVTHNTQVSKAIGEIALGDDRIRELLREMLAHDPEARPNPAEVKDRADALATEQADESLALAAYQFVPETNDLREDPTDLGLKAGDTQKPSEIHTIVAPVQPAEVQSSMTVVVLAGLALVVVAVVVLFGM